MSATMLRMGGYQGEASVHTRAARVLAAALADRQGPQLVLTPDVTKSGRNATDLFDMVEGDELDLCYFASSYLADRVPNLAVFDLPFLVESRAAMHAVLDGPLGEALAADIERRTGFSLLAFWDNGLRHFTNRHRPLLHPEDCRGLRIRTMDSALHQATFRALGFEPVYIDVKDYPAAVRSGAVDAQENPLTNTVNFAVQDTHKHLSLTGHFCGVTLLLANRARLDRLDTLARDALRGAATIATEAQRGFAGQADIDGMARLVADGVDICGPEAIDMAAFRAATAEVRAAVARTIDPGILAAFGSEHA